MEETELKSSQNNWCIISLSAYQIWIYEIGYKVDVYECFVWNNSAN